MLEHLSIVNSVECPHCCDVNNGIRKSMHAHCFRSSNEAISDIRVGYKICLFVSNLWVRRKNGGVRWRALIFWLFRARHLQHHLELLFICLFVVRGGGREEVGWTKKSRVNEPFRIDVLFNKSPMDNSNELIASQMMMKCVCVCRKISIHKRGLRTENAMNHKRTQLIMYYLHPQMPHRLFKSHFWQRTMSLCLSSHSSLAHRELSSAMQFECILRKQWMTSPLRFSFHLHRILVLTRNAFHDLGSCPPTYLHITNFKLQTRRKQTARWLILILLRNSFGQFEANLKWGISVSCFLFLWRNVKMWIMRYRGRQSSLVDVFFFLFLFSGPKRHLF